MNSCTHRNSMMAMQHNETNSVALLVLSKLEAALSVPSFSSLTSPALLDSTSDGAPVASAWPAVVAVVAVVAEVWPVWDDKGSSDEDVADDDAAGDVLVVVGSADEPVVDSVSLEFVLALGLSLRVADSSASCISGEPPPQDPWSSDRSVELSMVCTSVPQSSYCAMKIVSESRSNTTAIC
jgi:hypothetical protein